MVLDFSIFQSEQFLIPFLFILAIVFGSLNIANIFRNKGVNFLISLALAFFAASNTAFIGFLWSQFGNIAIFFIFMFFIIFILEAFGLRRGKSEEKKERAADSLIINSAILFVLLSISYLYMGQLPSLPFIGGGQNLLLLIFIVFILVIFWSAYRLGGPERR